MNRTRNIFRGLFFLLAVLLLIHLNRKTDVNLGVIAKFKYETLNKIKSDTLGSKAKLDLLVQETTKLNEQISQDSSHAQDVLYYLMGVVALFIGSELIFSIKAKRIRLPY